MFSYKATRAANSPRNPPEETTMGAEAAFPEALALEAVPEDVDVELLEPLLLEAEAEPEDAFAVPLALALPLALLVFVVADSVAVVSALEAAVFTSAAPVLGW